MANLTSSSITDGGTIQAAHITALYDALTGTTVYDNIAVTGTSSFALSASYAANATLDTGSLLTTASVSANTITFTKGDASTFGITVNTGSTATSASFASNIAVSELLDPVNYNLAYINTSDDGIARDADGEFYYNPNTNTLRVDNLDGNASTASTASYVTSSNIVGTVARAVTASYADNAGGSVDTGSLLTTASVSLNTITFTKGDASTFNITVDTGSGGGGGGTADALVAGGELLGLTTASGHIIPSTNNTYDLGSAEYKFRDLYLGSSTLYMSGSGGWMSGSWDGTNFKINNNALVRSAVTSSMSVGSAASADTATTANIATNATTQYDANRGGGTEIGTGGFLAGTATLSSGTITINTFFDVLVDSTLGLNCWITATATDGTVSNPLSVSLTNGNITITEIGGTSNGNVNYTAIYLLPG